MSNIKPAMEQATYDVAMVSGIYVLDGVVVTHAGSYGPGSFVWFPEQLTMSHGASQDNDVVILFIITGAHTDPALYCYRLFVLVNWLLNTNHHRWNLERMTQEERSEKQRELAEKESHLTNVRENYAILNRGISGVGDDDSDLAWKSEEATMEKEIAELKKQLAQDE